MPKLIVPEITPPQVTDDARDLLANAVLANGLTKVFQDSMQLFEFRHSDLKSFVTGFRFDQNGMPVKDKRTNTAFKIGAVIAGRAYLESGYEHQVDSAVFAIATAAAVSGGVPTVFLESAFTDLNLLGLVDMLLDTPEMQDGVEQGSYEEIVSLGAGCSRYYLQHAVKLEA